MWFYGISYCISRVVIIIVLEFCRKPKVYRSKRKSSQALLNSSQAWFNFITSDFARAFWRVILPQLLCECEAIATSRCQCALWLLSLSVQLRIIRNAHEFRRLIVVIDLQPCQITPRYAGWLSMCRLSACFRGRSETILWAKTILCDGDACVCALGLSIPYAPHDARNNCLSSCCYTTLYALWSQAQKLALSALTTHD